MYNPLLSNLCAAFVTSKQKSTATINVKGNLPSQFSNASNFYPIGLVWLQWWRQPNYTRVRTKHPTSTGLPLADATSHTRSDLINEKHMNVICRNIPIRAWIGRVTLSLWRWACFYQACIYKALIGTSKWLLLSALSSGYTNVHGRSSNSNDGTQEQDTIFVAVRQSWTNKARIVRGTNRVTRWGWRPKSTWVRAGYSFIQCHLALRLTNFS